MMIIFGNGPKLARSQNYVARSARRVQESLLRRLNHELVTSWSRARTERGTSLMEEVIPITERSNDITEDIDKANSIEIVNLLKKCDEEIFNGYKQYTSVQSKEFLAKLREVALKGFEYVSPSAEENVGIILSGCGTSGRIAFLISRAFNELANQQNLRNCYSYVCSGGDHGLMKSVESFEDDWNAGKEALVKESEGFKKILFIGITCGLAAPFVGGQVEYCLQHPNKFTPYLLGFNPADQARDAPVKGTKKVLLDIAKEMEEKGHLLNAIVGPEPIAGSSRMKGGTATKMILESIFIAAHQLALHKSTTVVCEQVISMYKMTLDLTYRNQQEIASVIDLAGESLRNGGSVTYLGWGSLGIMSMIDAAECVPTFGANHDDVRCFFKGGYETLRNKQGDLSADGDTSEIGFNYFMKKRCHTLSQKDTVIFILRSLPLQDKLLLREIAQLVKAKSSNIALIGITTDDDEQFQDVLNILEIESPVVACVYLPTSILKECCPDICEQQKFLEQCSAEIALKWVINAVSTGAHVMKGKVLKNYMIDLKLTNRKLFERAVSIVSLFGKVNGTQAKRCLLKSIYRTNTLSPEILEADISEHVRQAALVGRVIPLALLLSKDEFNLDSGLKTLEVCPIVRRCIDKFV